MIFIVSRLTVPKNIRKTTLIFKRERERKSTYLLACAGACAYVTMEFDENQSMAVIWLIRRVSTTETTNFMWQCQLFNRPEQSVIETLMTKTSSKFSLAYQLNRQMLHAKITSTRTARQIVTYIAARREGHNS